MFLYKLYPRSEKYFQISTDNLINQFVTRTDLKESLNLVSTVGTLNYIRTQLIVNIVLYSQLYFTAKVLCLY